MHPLVKNLHLNLLYEVWRTIVLGAISSWLFPLLANTGRGNRNKTTSNSDLQSSRNSVGFVVKVASARLPGLSS
ncbi:hypothetical protein Nepgr_020227 [Nepenthes gracilis]|uniref:Uncharacterized protein n=1 Tax=Nepenthes gracilis TaxID=150966 RepID=A0AAD3SWY6_NEPGR|nr:hypothetical protein Nepgr_020227 [Nepenthes gracilis]